MGSCVAALHCSDVTLRILFFDDWVVVKVDNPGWLDGIGHILILPTSHGSRHSELLDCAAVDAEDFFRIIIQFVPSSGARCMLLRRILHATTLLSAEVIVASIADEI